MPSAAGLASLILNREAFGDNEDLFNELERIVNAISSFQLSLVEDIEGNHGSNDKTDTSRTVDANRTMWKTRLLIEEPHTLRIDGRLYVIESIEIDGALEIDGEMILVEI